MSAPSPEQLAEAEAMEQARLNLVVVLNVADLETLLAALQAKDAALRWIMLFADMRSKDESKVFARVNRGALRTISERAATALGDPT